MHPTYEQPGLTGVGTRVVAIFMREEALQGHARSTSDCLCCMLVAYPISTVQAPWLPSEGPNEERMSTELTPESRTVLFGKTVAVPKATIVHRRAVLPLCCRHRGNKGSRTEQRTIFMKPIRDSFLLIPSVTIVDVRTFVCLLRSVGQAVDS